MVKNTTNGKDEEDIEVEESELGTIENTVVPTESTTLESSKSLLQYVNKAKTFDDLISANKSWDFCVYKNSKDDNQAIARAIKNKTLELIKSATRFPELELALKTIGVFNDKNEYPRNVPVRFRDNTFSKVPSYGDTESYQKALVAIARRIFGGIRAIEQQDEKAKKLLGFGELLGKAMQRVKDSYSVSLSTHLYKTYDSLKRRLKALEQLKPGIIIPKLEQPEEVQEEVDINKLFDASVKNKENTLKDISTSKIYAYYQKLITFGNLKFFPDASSLMSFEKERTDLLQLLAVEAVTNSKTVEDLKKAEKILVAAAEVNKDDKKAKEKLGEALHQWRGKLKDLITQIKSCSILEMKKFFDLIHRGDGKNLTRYEFSLKAKFGSYYFSSKPTYGDTDTYIICLKHIVEIVLKTKPVPIGEAPIGSEEDFLVELHAAASDVFKFFANDEKRDRMPERLSSKISDPEKIFALEASVITIRYDF